MEDYNLKYYQAVLILKPGLESYNKIITHIQDGIEQCGAYITNTEKLGMRRLAYDMRGFSERILFSNRLPGS